MFKKLENSTRTFIKNFKKEFGEKGFVFSLEGVVVLIVFCTLLFAINLNNFENDFNELIIFQQENDLLKVWSSKGFFEKEGVRDCKKMFDAFELFVNDKKVFSTKKRNYKNSVSSEANIIKNNLEKEKIRILVYY